jgi:hypothetical protein
VRIVVVVVVVVDTAAGMAVEEVDIGKLILLMDCKADEVFHVASLGAGCHIAALHSVVVVEQLPSGTWFWLKHDPLVEVVEVVELQFLRVSAWPFSQDSYCDPYRCRLRAPRKYRPREGCWMQRMRCSLVPASMAARTPPGRPWWKAGLAGSKFGDLL